MFDRFSKGERERELERTRVKDKGVREQTETHTHTERDREKENQSKRQACERTDGNTHREREKERTETATSFSNNKKTFGFWGLEKNQFRYYHKIKVGPCVNTFLSLLSLSQYIHIYLVYIPVYK